VGVKTLHNAISISVCTVSYEALCVMVNYSVILLKQCYRIFRGMLLKKII